MVSIQCSLFLISCVLKQNVCGFVRMRVYDMFFVVLESWMTAAHPRALGIEGGISRTLNGKTDFSGLRFHGLPRSRCAISASHGQMSTKTDKTFGSSPRPC